MCVGGGGLESLAVITGVLAQRLHPRSLVAAATETWRPVSVCVLNTAGRCAKFSGCRAGLVFL